MAKPFKFTQGEFDVAVAAAREAVDKSGYGFFVKDAQISTYVDKLFDVIETYRQENPDDTKEREDL